MKKKTVAAKSIASSKAKVISKKKTKAKVEVKKELNVGSSLKPQKSISRIVFDFISSKNLLESDNRKAAYEELLQLVLADFPTSRFKKTHFFWYLSRANKQKQNGLALTHLITIPKETVETDEE